MSTSYISRCEELEAQELSLRGSRLTSDNYAELILFYFVQQRFMEAKYCYQRALTRGFGPALKELFEINQDLRMSKFGEALKKCRSLSISDELRPYVIELKKRLIAVQLELVGRCYSSIEKNNLAALLGLVDAGRIVDETEANEIFDALLDPIKFGWSCTDGGMYIAPNSTSPNFAATLSTLVDVVSFGPMKSERHNVSSINVLNTDDISELRALIACNDSFDSQN